MIEIDDKHKQVLQWAEHKSEIENITTWRVPVGVKEEINCLPDYRLCPSNDKYVETRFGRYRFEEIKVRWLIGGRLISTELSLKHTFERPGVYWITGKIYDKQYKLLDYVTGKVIAESGPPWSPEMLEQHPAWGIRVQAYFYDHLKEK